ncbi:tetratricopeptide repeat protein [Muricauda sp. TY007]|uniref:tetratricopeptide repeat protein n=1 Tax=Allomuricauda sp. TY007 TaxID=2683200 RepID=UPI0013C24E89|nr:tetratricopeptide repeat protein [Muricauda sp. TY007]NDV14468.1 tetratricopeptide repeat protein [Muricauda sp. TY007]
MKTNFLLTIFVFFTLLCFAQKDSISIQELKIIQLEDEIDDLNRTLEKSNEHIKELLIENEKLSNSNFEKIDGRLTNFIWLISVLGGLSIALLTFFGWKYLSNSINNFFTERVQELSDAKLNKIVTEKWIREQVVKKSEQPIKKAIEDLQLDFVNISEQLINDEKSKWQKHHEQAIKTVEEIENLRTSLEKEGLNQKSSKLNPEDRLKVKAASETPKNIENFNWEDWFWKGRNEFEEGKFRDAAFSFTKAKELNPTDSNITVWLGSIKNDIGEYEQAIEDLDKAIELNPKNDIAWNNRGVAKNELKNWEEAIKDFSQAIKLDPTKDASWANLGYSKSHLGRHKEAIKDLDKAIDLNPESEIAFSNRGYAKNEVGDYKGAIEDFDRALKINPKNDTSWNNRAFANIELENYDEAQLNLEEVFKINPKNQFAYFNLGNMQQKQNNIKDACLAWKKALDLGYSEAQEKLNEFCNSKD